MTSRAFLLSLFAFFFSLLVSEGQNWTPVTTGLPANPVVVATAGNGTIMVIGVSQPLISAGVYLSSDGGNSWTKTTGTMAGSTYADTLMVVGNTILAGRNASNGILYRSTDNGASWQLATGLPASGNVTMFARDGSTLYAQEAVNGPYKSTDDGATWSLINSGLDGTPGNLGVLNGRVFTSRINSGVWVSANQGSLWTKILTASAFNLTRQAVFANKIFFPVNDPNVPQLQSVTHGSDVPQDADEGLPLTLAIADMVTSSTTIFAGGGTNFVPSVWQSVDAGATWAKLTATGLSAHSVLRLWVQGETLFASTFDTVGSTHGFFRLALSNGGYSQPPTIVKQPAAVTSGVGQKATFTVTAYGQGPFTYQWRSNNIAIAGATSSTFTLLNLQATYAANYSVDVINGAGTTPSTAAALTIIPTTPGNVDLSFNTLPMGTDFSGFILGGNVQTIAQQPDGKVLAAGSFNRVNGTPGGSPTGGTVCRNIIRFNADGTLDSSFSYDVGADASITAIVIQPDGKILIGGHFSTYKGVTRRCLARLNSDGTLDTGFMASGNGFIGSVHALALLPDGKILVGGNYTSFNSNTRGRLVRLNADGTEDTSFLNGLSGANNAIFSLALDGSSIYVAGNFTTFNGTGRVRIAKLQSTGALDTDFIPDTGITGGQVNSIALQPSGKLVVVGSFTAYRGNAVNHIVRITSTGGFDYGFGGGLNNLANCVVMQPDGKFIVSGGFTTVDSVARGRIVRFLEDGTLDATFGAGAGAGSQVFTLALQPDGQLLAGGSFTTFNGQPRYLVARVFAATPAPSIAYFKNGSMLEINWSGNFDLQHADDLTPPVNWQTVIGPSPASVPLNGTPKRFFRLIEKE